MSRTALILQHGDLQLLAARRQRERVEIPLRALAIDDGEALLERGRKHAEEAKGAAFELFDAFWERAR